MNPDPFFSDRPEGPRQQSFRVSVRQFGVLILFVSLSVLFGASILAYVLTRTSNDVWRTPDMPTLPLGLVGSTALLLGVSAAAQYGLTCARHNRFDSLNRALRLTFAFAAAFLIGQTFNWLHMIRSFAPGARSLYAYTFYLLTGLHAVHVLAGFVPLAIVIKRARRKEYTSSRLEGVKFCVQYWHFLGLVWLVLLSTLYWGSAT
jgi:cytochrome c oxidase subunit 3